MRRTAIRAAAVLMAAASPAAAADGDGNFFARGVGAQSCQSYVDAVQGGDPAAYLFRSWINGYVTAQNQVRAETYDLAPDATAESLAAAAARVCARAPEQPFWAAAHALVETARPHRQKAQGDPAEIAWNGRAVSVQPATLRRVQQALKDAGYGIATVDGVYGRNTRQALQAFQRDAGLEETGLPDAPTRARLAY